MNATNAKPSTVSCLPGKVTRGPWNVTTHNGQYEVRHDGSADHRWHVADVYPAAAEAEANALLIAEAGTVYHETGLTPRQLAERVAELEKALQRIIAIKGSTGGPASLIAEYKHIASVALTNGE